MRNYFNIIYKSIFRKPLEFSLIILVVIISKILFCKKRKRIWLIGCGGERWGDNADAFWRYMNLNHPEIKAIAVIKKKTVINKENNNWIKRNRLYNFVLILLAEVLATTHSLSDIGPDCITSLSKAKKVWLQHGVIGIKKIAAQHAVSGCYDLICTSSEKEKYLIVNELGVKHYDVAITGLARHDVLRKVTEQTISRNGILFIPTLRTGLQEKEVMKYEKLLFSWITRVVNNNNKILIRLWLHPGWYKYHLKDPGTLFDNVYSFKVESDPQQLICESRLLITDYSSIFFDAALSGIPTIFYQPDRCRYREINGLFEDFMKQDDLLIVKDENDLLEATEKILNDSEYYCQRLEKDRQWVLKYVETFDGKSCTRIYQQIEQLLKMKIGE